MLSTLSSALAAHSMASELNPRVIVSHLLLYTHRFLTIELLDSRYHHVHTLGCVTYMNILLRLMMYTYAMLSLDTLENFPSDAYL